MDEAESLIERFKEHLREGLRKERNHMSKHQPNSQPQIPHTNPTARNDTKLS